MEIMMEVNLAAKVKTQLEEIDSLLKDALERDIIPDRAYTQLVTKLGHIETAYMRDEFRSINQDYYNWVKIRLEKISGFLINLKKSASFTSIPREDLMHATGDYYNEDNSIMLTADIKQSIKDIINDTYKN